MRGRISLVLLCASAALIAGVGPGSAHTMATRKLTVYSVASQVQYLNNADDEARGMTNNPFDTALNKLRPKQTWKGTGPFAGDVAIYAFKLYSDPSLKRVAGSATYTCYFNYDKNAFCDADFSLEPGSTTLLASGPVDFKRKGFALIVTGGTSGYVGARGQVAEETLPTRNAQRLRFALVD